MLVKGTSHFPFRGLEFRRVRLFAIGGLPGAPSTIFFAAACHCCLGISPRHFPFNPKGKSAELSNVRPPLGWILGIGSGRAPTACAGSVVALLSEALGSKFVASLGQCSAEKYLDAWGNVSPMSGSLLTLYVPPSRPTGTFQV